MIFGSLLFHQLLIPIDNKQILTTAASSAMIGKSAKSMNKPDSESQAGEAELARPLQAPDNEAKVSDLTNTQQTDESQIAIERELLQCSQRVCHNAISLVCPVTLTVTLRSVDRCSGLVHLMTSRSNGKRVCERLVLQHCVFDHPRLTVMKSYPEG